MRAEAPGPKMDIFDLSIARGEAFYERYKRGEVKLTEEEPAGQTRDPNRPRTIAEMKLHSEPYIG